MELASFDVSCTHFCLHCASVTQTQLPSSVVLPAHDAQSVNSEHRAAAHASPSSDAATTHKRASRTFIPLGFRIEKRMGKEKGEKKRRAVTLEERKDKKIISFFLKKSNGNDVLCIDW